MPAPRNSHTLVHCRSSRHVYTYVTEYRSSSNDECAKLVATELVVIRISRPFASKPAANRVTKSGLMHASVNELCCSENHKTRIAKIKNQTWSNARNLNNQARRLLDNTQARVRLSFDLHDEKIFSATNISIIIRSNCISRQGLVFKLIQACA